MRVRVLGGFSVEGVPERELGSRKGRTLLKVLALARGGAVPVDRIADVLWGDDPPSRPADQVGVLVSRLRGVLGPDRLTRTDAGYALVADWLDVAEVETLGEAAASALAAGRVGAARAAADAALALARGPLLGDEDGAWVEADRASAAAAVTRVRRLAVDAATAAGDLSGAAALAEQALAADPYDEVVLQALMKAHLAAGRPASALAAYARVRERLADDLGVPPTAETEALWAQALAAADGDRAEPPPRPSRPAGGLVGRDADLAVLDRALAAAAAGGAALVAVEGEAGMGKTALVDTWLRSIEAEAVVLRGRCDELGRDLPLQPVADALADHLRAGGASRVKDVVGEAAPALAPLLGPVAGVEATAVADAEAGRVRVFSALAGAVERAGGALPTVLFVDDLHLAGEGTRAWLAFARRRCRRTVLVTAARPGAPAPAEATDRVVLGPLDAAAVAELVGDERAAAVYRRTGGHPLLVAALAADTGDRPASLQAMVAQRVDSLGADVGATLRIAAVLGAGCDLDLIAQVSDLPAVKVLGHLEAAAVAGLVAEQGSRFVFHHELVREALEAATGGARRSLVHRRAAARLAARPDPDPLAVAVHAREGGDAALAATWYVAAAHAAAARYDLAAAEEHLAAALAQRATPEAYVARARVRMSRLALEEAAADAARAVAVGGGAPALEAAGWVAYYRRRYEEARAFADEATARAGEGPLQVSATALAGRVRHGAGDLAGAADRLAAVDGGPPAVQGIVDVWLAQVRIHQGRPTDALATLARPMVDPDSLAHPWAPLHLRFVRMLALGQTGRPSDALRVAVELAEVIDRTGPVGQRFVASAANARAWILRWSGRVGEADEENRRALEATEERDLSPVPSLAEAFHVALLDLADGRLLAGDVAGAAALEARLASLDSWQGTMAWHQRHRLGLLRARLALADGRPDLAASLAGSVAGDAAARGAGRYELLARAVEGLADPGIPVERLAPVVEGLGRCARLDGWSLVATLAGQRRCAPWKAEAERWVASLVADLATGGTDGRAGDDRLRRFASSLLGD